MTDIVTRTLIVKTRGRKYFSCLLGGYQAQLVIDDVTEGLELDRIVTIEAEDLSTKSSYGTTLRFRALQVVGDRSAAEARQIAAARKDAEKWLGYAEDDVAHGLARTNAVRKALELAPAHEHLAERLEGLKDAARQVLAEDTVREAELWLRRAEDDVARGWYRTRAVRETLQRAGDHPHLAERFDALKAEISAGEGGAVAASARPRTTLLTFTPQLGVAQRLNGRLVVYTRVVRQRRIDEDDPSVYGAHVLGAEGDMGVEVEYRDPTPDEQDAWETAAAAERARIAQAKAWQQAVDAIAGSIRAAGDIPAGPVVLDGDKLCGEPDIYGGGSWFVIQPDAIWWVENNGADGDDWSRNNVRTGGAGAIGWRIPTDPGLVDQIIALHQERTHVDR